METYKNIEGYDNYEISDLGNVRNRKSGRILKYSTGTIGYYYVGIYKNGNMKNAFIHRLIAETFISNPLNKPEVDHIDRNPLNNRISNLRWATKSENQLNKKVYSNNSSTISGIYKNRNRNKYVVRITINGKRKYIGLFETFEEAGNARCESEEKYFSEFRPKTN